LFQDASLGGRISIVRKHALVMQLRQLAQLRYPRRLIIRDHGRGLGRGRWPDGSCGLGGGSGSRAGRTYGLRACGIYSEVTPELLDLRHVPVLGDPPGAVRSGRARHLTYVTQLCAGDLKAPAADGTDQVVVRPVGHDRHEIQAHRLLRPDVVEENLVMTVRAHAERDLTPILRVAWSEADKHHAVSKAETPAPRFLRGG
jgi:hypothetical protein